MLGDVVTTAEGAPAGGRRRFVLVAGMPRSGTTGVGAGLAHAPGAASLYEPLNPESGLLSVRQYFVLPPLDGADPVLERQLDQVFRVDVRMRRGIWSRDPHWKRLVKNVTGSGSRSSAVRIRLDPRVRTVIWKDPFASFLVPLLARTHRVPAVVTVRPPAAAAASIKRLGWHFDLERVRRHLETLAPAAPFLRGLERRTPGLDDPAVIGAVLWRLVYGYLDHALPRPGQEGQGAPVLWANSSALLTNPLDSYQTFYDRLGLDLTPRAREGIARDYRDEGSSEPQGGVTHDRRRNVQQANAYWAKVLTEGEQAMVEELTGDVRAGLERRTGPLS